MNKDIPFVQLENKEESTLNSSDSSQSQVILSSEISQNKISSQTTTSKTSSILSQPAIVSTFSSSVISPSSTIDFFIRKNVEKENIDVIYIAITLIFLALVIIFIKLKHRQ
jgi:hypothetical protein